MGHKKRYSVEKYTLCPENIDRISEKVDAFCKSEKIGKSVCFRHRLSVEESLGTWLEKSNGEEITVILETGSKLTRPYIKLTSNGIRINPYDNDSSKEEYGHGKNDILMRLGLIPEYSYTDGNNILIYRPKRKPLNQIAVLLCVIILAFVVGIAGNLIIPENILSGISNGFISPVESAFFRVLSAIAGPMIFLSVAWGVYGIGDVYTLGKIGKKMMIAFMTVIFLFCGLGLFFYPLLGPVLSGSSESGNQFAKIFEMFLSVIPANIFSPFEDGNTLQIIFLAVIIGMSMIFLGQRTSSVARAVEQINHIITFLMEFISKMVPFFVFIVMVNLIWSKSISVFSDVWKFAVVFISVSMLGQFLFLCYISIRHKKSPAKLFKAILPSFLIALTTASSSASFESNMTVCNNKFGIKKELSSFGIPFGMVVFKPVSAIYYLLICFYFAGVNNIPTSVWWIITAFVMASVTAVAVPPIPGGATAVYSVLFLQLGIPSSALAVVIAVDMLFDFFITSGNINMLLLELFNISKKLGMNTEKNVL